MCTRILTHDSKVTTLCRERCGGYFVTVHRPRIHSVFVQEYRITAAGRAALEVSHG
jgi:hypothetical protein